jgi:hypothetical protein
MLETVKNLGEPLCARLRVIAKAEAQTLSEALARQTATTQASVPVEPPPAKSPVAD